MALQLNFFLSDSRLFTNFRYPNYDIVGDPNIAKTAGIATRYSNNSLYGILLDIHLLSLSDHLVCTFSSQVCRVAYEIMQTYDVDATSHFTSLDDVYYYGGQNGHSSVVRTETGISFLPHFPVNRFHDVHPQFTCTYLFDKLILSNAFKPFSLLGFYARFMFCRQAILPHEPENLKELALKVGDEISVAGNHWDGYSKGRNLRTNQVGLYPSFKVSTFKEANSIYILLKINNCKVKT